MRTIGIAGTAKNTGKTTTAVEILARCGAAGIPFALTSIGYDGENRDNVTGLPKPRFQLEPGAVFATAESCLKVCTAGYQVLAHTEIKTALGHVVLARVTTPGLVLIAGPNRRIDMQRLFDIIAEIAGARFVLVDGALNRLVPLIGTDGLILSTGAALDEHIDNLVRHTQALLKLHHPQKVTPKMPPSGRIQLLSTAGDLQEILMGSLLSADTAAQMKAALGGEILEMVIPGACHPKILVAFLKENAARLEGMRLIFGNPLNLIASGHPLEWETAFAEMDNLYIRTGYLEKNPLYFVTVNPFYPCYNQQTGTYLPAYVDKYWLLQSMRAAIRRTPVIDVFQPPVPDLLELCHIKT